MLAERLAKRMRHLAKWAQPAADRLLPALRAGHSRLPDRDRLVRRSRRRSISRTTATRSPGSTIARATTPLDKTIAYRRDAEAEILAGLAIPRERLFVKHRGRQRDAEGGREQYERHRLARRRSSWSRSTARASRSTSRTTSTSVSSSTTAPRGSPSGSARRASGFSTSSPTPAPSRCTHGPAAPPARPPSTCRAPTSSGSSGTWRTTVSRPNADHVTVHADCLQWLEAGPAAGEAVRHRGLRSAHLLELQAHEGRIVRRRARLSAAPRAGGPFRRVGRRDLLLDQRASTSNSSRPTCRRASVRTRSATARFRRTSVTGRSTAAGDSPKAGSRRRVDDGVRGRSP